MKWFSENDDAGATGSVFDEQQPTPTGAAPDETEENSAEEQPADTTADLTPDDGEEDSTLNADEPTEMDDSSTAVTTGVDRSIKDICEDVTCQASVKAPCTYKLLHDHKMQLPDYTYNDEDFQKFTEYRMYYNFMKPKMIEVNKKMNMMHQ